MGWLIVGIWGAMFLMIVLSVVARIVARLRLGKAGWRDFRAHQRALSQIRAAESPSKRLGKRSGGDGLR